MRREGGKERGEGNRDISKGLAYLRAPSLLVDFGTSLTPTREKENRERVGESAGLAKKFVRLMNTLFNKVLGENEKMRLLFLLRTERPFWPTQYNRGE